MSNKELAKQFGYEYVFENSESDVVDIDGKKWMRIAFAGKWFLVPLVNVSDSPDVTVAIAYINTDYSKNRQLALAAKETYQKLFKENGTRAVFYFTSTKSQWSIEKAAAEAGIDKVYLLPGGKKRRDVENASFAGQVESYIPATGIETFVGLPQNIESIASSLMADGITTIDLVDDVWSTGASLDAAEKILKEMMPDIKIRRMVLAREAGLGPKYPPDMTVKANGVADIAIPVIVGAYAADQLVHVSQKDTERGIPAAISVPV